MIRVRFLGVLLAMVVVGSAADARAQVPELIRYQGILVDGQGAPIDGSYNLTFRMYDAATVGTELWSETQSAVAVSDGAFSVLLGQVTPLVLTFDADYWLSTEVGADGEMSPRQQLTSVAYAYRAAYADNAGGIEGGDLIPDNLLLNGSFEEWDFTPPYTVGYEPPVSWSMWGITNTVDSIEPLSTAYKQGAMAIRLYENGNPDTAQGCALQTLAAGTWEHLKGQDVTAAVWARAESGTANVTLQINTSTDDIKMVQQVGESWELVTVSWTLPTNCTWVQYRVYPVDKTDTNHPAGTAYFDGAMLVEGSSPLIYISEAGSAEVARRLDKNYTNASVPLNHITGGSFESWSKGTSNPPDGWPTNYGDAVAKVTTAGDVKVGSAAVQVNGGASGSRLRKTIQDAALEGLKGRWISFGCWVKSSVANSARIHIEGAQSAERWVDHSGSGQWEYLTTSIEVEPNETILIITLGKNGNTAGIYDGVCLYEGQMMFGYCPNPADTSLSITNYRDTAGVNSVFEMMRIESGTVNLAFNGSSEAQVTVPYASTFNKVLGVLTDVNDPGYAEWIETGAVNVATNLATIKGRRVNGATVPGVVPVFYIVIGID